MLKTTIFSALVAAGLAATTGTAIAQSPPPPNARSAIAAARDYRVKQVLGSKVNIEGNLDIGTVDDIVFGDDGVVEYLIVNNQGKLVTVPWQAAKFNFENRTAVIAITQEQFRTIPTYTVDHYPTFYAPAYRTQIYKYYNLTPREIRRAERRP